MIPNPEQLEGYRAGLLMSLQAMLNPSGGADSEDMMGAFFEEAEILSLFPPDKQVAAIFAGTSVGLDAHEAAIYLVMFEAAQEAHGRRFWHMFDRRRNERKAKLESMMKVIASGAFGRFGGKSAERFFSAYSKRKAS